MYTNLLSPARGWRSLYFLIASLFCVSIGYGEDITYNGTNPPLQTTPDWAGGDGTTTSLFFPSQTSNNTITIDYIAGTDPFRVFGGLSQSENITDNQITMTNGAITDRIFGGYATGMGLTVSRNSVTMSGGSTVHIYGGFSSDGNAVENSVSVSSGATVTGGYVIGGYSGNQDAKDNRVSISGGTVGSLMSAFVIGGWTTGGSGKVSGNGVALSGNSIVDGYAYGAFSGAGGDVSDNEVALSGNATVEGYVFGAASSGTGNVYNNRVTVDGGTAKQNVLGGESQKAGTVSNNSVEMTGGTVNWNVFGGISASGASSFNRAIISGGVVQGSVSGGEGGTTASVTNNNSVELFGTGRVAGTVIGGAGRSSSIETSVYANTVSISEDAAVGRMIIGGYANAGLNSTKVYDNQVFFSGGNVGSDTVDGITASIFGGLAGRGDANGNSVTISGGTVAGDVYGGAVGSGTGGAINNIITITGAPVLTDSNLYGGGTHTMLGHATGNFFTGNTLKVHEYAGTGVKSVNNFNNFDFLIPTSLAGGDAALTVANASDISNSNISVNFVAGGPTLKVNDQITLINNIGLTASGINSSAQARQGALLLYDLEVFTDSNNLYAGVRSEQAAPEAKSVSEGRLASLAFLNQGQDFIARSGYDAANAYLGTTGDGWSVPAFFGGVGGGHSRHKTGSHVDVDGVSALFGMAWRNNGPCGSLLVGAFFEAGYADYDTRNAFASGPVRGDGDSRYFGGGFLARYDWQSGLYVEASGRVGGIKNKFHSDLSDYSGNRVEYDINSPYFGAHAGVGYQWQMLGKTVLDLSAKYLWSRQNSDSAVVTGSQVDFAATTSHRVRTGARLAYAMNDCFAPYVGVAFEYEFNGKARGAVSNYNLGAPSLKGGTGIGEIGLTMRRNSFSADLGVQGHLGRRDGVTGTVRIGWSF